MTKLVHSMIRVLDEAVSVQFYRDTFGLEVVDRLDFENFTLIYMALPTAAFELELTINKGRETPYDLGDGYG
ncbi:MAG: VOC family protein, partial [Pseudomonadota bacterium]